MKLIAMKEGKEIDLTNEKIFLWDDKPHNPYQPILAEISLKQDWAPIIAIYSTNENKDATGVRVFLNGDLMAIELRRELK